MPPQEPAASGVEKERKDQLASPRDTFRTFLGAFKEDGNLGDAVACLEPSAADKVNLDQAAYDVKELLDTIAYVRYEHLPDDPDYGLSYSLSEYLRAAGVTATAEQQRDAERIVLVRGDDDLWRFSEPTVTSAFDLLKEARRRAPVEGVIDRGQKPLSIVLRDLFPANLHTKYFLLRNDQWICLLVLIFLGFLADQLVRFLLHHLTKMWFRFVVGDADYRVDRRLWRPLGLLTQALLWYGGTRLLGLPDFAQTLLLYGVQLFAVIAAVWTSFLLIDLAAVYLASKARGTKTRFDDLLIPLTSKSLKVFAVCVGVISCAQAFNLPIAGLIGGLGIGGAAIAFASKDAIANLFGSVTVLTDRPFEIGDWIKTDGIEGTVETVGFRSTRVRTFYNSLITLPNSRLTTAIVDNMGRRRYRRITATLAVQYDTAPQQIDAFCEGVRELIRRHPYTRKDYYHVYLNGFSDSSLDIMLYCFVECPDWSVELREKHRLFVDIIKLAEELEVSFAFPTRTLHLYQEQHGEDGKDRDWADAESVGQRLAAGIAGPLLGPTERPAGVEFRGPTAVPGIDEK
jgi:MscS family membrane protein